MVSKKVYSVPSLLISIALVLCIAAFTAFAQTATTTEEIVEDPSAVVGETSVATTSNDGTETEEEVGEVTVEEEPVVEESLLIVTLDTAQEESINVALQEVEASSSAVSVADQISALQEEYFGKNGTYLQILSNNQLPEYESGSVSTNLGGTLPDNAYVHVYESPKGKGYQIFYNVDGVQYSFGYGPETEDRTYSYSLPQQSATSTEAVSETSLIEESVEFTTSTEESSSIESVETVEPTSTEPATSIEPETATTTEDVVSRIFRWLLSGNV